MPTVSLSAQSIEKSQTQITELLDNRGYSINTSIALDALALAYGFKAWETLGPALDEGTLERSLRSSQTKRRARNIRKFLKQENIDISQASTYQLLALAYGYDDWNDVAKTLNKATPI